MMPKIIHQTYRRIKTLDALRGVAALAVVLGHLTGGFYIANLVDSTPLYVLRAGHEAVIFFFMLSGYVLVYQYGLKEHLEYKKFLVLRFFRLYIPYIFSIFFGIILFLLAKPNSPNYIFISQLWQSKLDMETILGHLFLIGNFNTGAINGVIWSLVQEMRFAILFPLLLYILNLKPVKLLIVIILITLLAAGGIALCTFLKTENYNGYIGTPYFFYMFLAGGYIAKNQRELLFKHKSLNRTAKLVLIIAAIILYSYAHTVTLAIANHIYIPGLVRLRFLIEDFLTASASFYFIIAAIGINGKKNMLETPIPLFLGKISYSLYLVHLPILAFLYFTLRDKLPLPAILLPGFIISILAAIAFNKYFETGAVKLGKRILARYFDDDKNTRANSTH